MGGNNRKGLYVGKNKSHLQMFRHSFALRGIMSFAIVRRYFLISVRSWILQLDAVMRYHLFMKPQLSHFIAQA